MYLKAVSLPFEGGFLPPTICIALFCNAGGARAGSQSCGKKKRMPSTIVCHAVVTCDTRVAVLHLNLGRRNNSDSSCVHLTWMDRLIDEEMRKPGTASRLG